MQYKNYLPYATSMESPPPGLTTVFNFSLEEEKTRPKEEEKKTETLIPQNILVPKSGTCRDNIPLVTCLGSRETESCKKSPQCASIGAPLPPAPPGPAAPAALAG